MILRSSSSPILSSLDHRYILDSPAHLGDGNDCSTTIASASPLRLNPSIAPHRHLSISVPVPYSPASASSCSSDSVADPRFTKSMRRARSEGDLQSFGGGLQPSDPDFVVCKSRWRPRTFVKFCIDEEDEEDLAAKFSIDEEIDENDSMIAECYSDGTRTSVPACGEVDDDVDDDADDCDHHYDRELELRLKALDMASTVATKTPVACQTTKSNASRHTRSRSASESLNLLYMASGVGTCREPCLSGDGCGRGGSRGGCGGGGGGSGGSFNGYGGSFHGDSDTTESYYQKLLQADPQNPLVLRNYAQYLSETKHDFKKSEEYYERAILACPDDGEVLSKYAKHVWDRHKDSERAESYFGRAVEATPDDCYVLASYASFLWQSEDDDDTAPQQTFPVPLHGVAGAYSRLIAST